DRAELGLEPYQAARRNHELEAHATLAVGLHVLQQRLALAEARHHAALVLLLEVDHELLVRLHELAVDFANDDFRARHRELVALAPHGFDQDRQVQLAATADLELVGVVGVLDAQRDVVLGLAHEAVAQLARSQELAAATLLDAR